MLRSDYTGQECSVARSLEILGERWTMLIVRDAFLGVRRFEDFQRDLGIARNVLQTRLEKLVEAEIFERRLYQERPERFEYRLTPRGEDLWPVVVSLLHWGDEHLAPDGPPVVLRHRGCGGEVDEHRYCTKCGAALTARDSMAMPGPGLPPGASHPLRERWARGPAA